MAKWTAALLLQATHPCSANAAKQSVPANRDAGTCGKDLAGQGKREPQHVPAVSSSRVASSEPKPGRVTTAWPLASLGISLLPLERDPMQTHVVRFAC